VRTADTHWLHETIESKVSSRGDCADMDQCKKERLHSLELTGACLLKAIETQDE